MADDLVDRAHALHRLGVVRAAQEEDLARELLAHLLGQVRRPVARVEGTHVGVGLLEAGVLARRERQVGDHVQRMPAAGRPPVDHRDDHLRHGADQPLHLQDVQAAALDLDAGLVDGIGGGALDVGIMRRGVLVAGTAADALVAARAERPAAVLGGGAVAGQQHHAHVRRAARVVQRAVQLVDRVRAEGVAHLGAVERDADDAVLTLRAHVAVVRDVGEVLEPRHGAPLVGAERIGG